VNWRLLIAWKKKRKKRCIWRIRMIENVFEFIGFMKEFVRVRAYIKR
jgi:hypothetical protein